MIIEFDRLVLVNSNNTLKYYNVIKNGEKIAFLSTDNRHKIKFDEVATHSSFKTYYWSINS